MNVQTVTRRRATTTTDRYGNTVANWSTPAELAIDGCIVAPDTNAETNDLGRQGVLVGWSLFRHSDADIEALDRIVTADGTFEVDGEPARWSSPHSALRGIDVQLRRMEG